MLLARMVCANMVLMLMPLAALAGEVADMAPRDGWAVHPTGYG